ncbi:MAG: geranylgeranyl reductase family protein [Candidatus Thorarchaeota archaeon]
MLYDLTVVGGGPAGATCARLAAEKGLDVILLEKAHHPRPKPCGGALGPQAIHHLDLDITPVIERTFRAAVVQTPSGHKVTLESDDLIGHIVSRTQFDALLFQGAIDAGVEVVEGVEVVGVEQLRSGIRALAVGDSFRSHLLVGADGVNSIVAKELGIRTSWSSKDFGVCIVADNVVPEDAEPTKVREDDESSHAIELYFGLVSWGYGWCFPKKRGFNIGIGCRADKVNDLQKVWERFVTNIERKKGSKLDIPDKVSHRIPLGGRVTRFTGRRSLLIGDAAGLVSPLTGEGISYAIESGRLAAEIAIETVKKQTPLHIIEYEKRLKKTIGRELSDTRWIAGILNRSRRHTDILFHVAAEDALMKEYMTNIVSRVTTFSDVKSKVMKRMLTKHPLKSIRLGLRS